MRIIHYNVNPNQRPSNAKLSRDSFMNCVTSASIGSIITPIAALMANTADQPLTMALFLPVSIAITVALFLPYHFYRGHRKKKDFIAAGGDPTGITLWMFGSMGGKLLADGTWQWEQLPSSKEDYYNSSESTPLKDTFHSN